MNIFESVEFNSMMYVGPIIVLIITGLVLGAIYTIVFKNLLEKKIFNYLFGVVGLLTAYIWYRPMNMGFYEMFKTWGM
jgi:uncharacterized MnhB-related membrane protein